MLQLCQLIFIYQPELLFPKFKTSLKLASNGEKSKIQICSKLWFLIELKSNRALIGSLIIQVPKH